MSFMRCPLIPNHSLIRGLILGQSRRRMSKKRFKRSQSDVVQRPSFSREMRKPLFSSTKDPQLPSSSDFDTFGTLDPDHFILRSLDDLDDDDPQDRHEAKIADTMRPRPVDFLRKMNKLSSKEQRDLKEALVLVEEMKEELVKPREKHYRVLIHACAREGYHDKAFELFKGYRSRGFGHNFGIFSDLFNSCANSPFPESALKAAKYLRKKLLSDPTTGVLPTVTYHTMLKAFGRCGDLQTAFSIVDEMKEKSVLVTEETYSHLLQGCISDKKAGFRHALMVWRSLIEEKHLRPNHFIANLLLRATKECGSGESEFSYDILLACMSVQEAQKHRLLIEESHGPRLAIGAGEEEEGLTTDQEDTSSTVDIVERKRTEIQVQERASKEPPNLLAKRPNFANVVSLGTLSTPQDRFALLGGVDGFFKQMKHYKIRPNVKMVSHVLHLIDETEEAEERLMDKMRSFDVELDTGFINQLMKRRASRKDYDLGRRTLDLANKHGVGLDLFTFGILSLCCRTRQHIVQLFEAMESHGGCSPNLEIFGALLSSASHRMSPSDVTFIMRKMDSFGVRTNKKVLRTLEMFRQRFRDQILIYEKDPESARVHNTVRREASDDFPYWRRFCEYYDAWLKSTERDPDADSHPWRQFLTDKEVERGKIERKYKNILNWEATDSS